MKSAELLTLNAVIEHRAPEEETRRYVEILEHFWVIVKKSLTLSLLWFSGALCSIHRGFEAYFFAYFFGSLIRYFSGLALNFFAQELQQKRICCP